MKVQKETQVATTGVATPAQLAAINAQAKAELTAEQVYVFSVRLCDDQIDRDMERFDRIAACSDGCREAFASVLQVI